MFKAEGYKLMGAAFEVGYLINFGRKGDLEWKRLILSDLHSPPRHKEAEGNTNLR